MAMPDTHLIILQLLACSLTIYGSTCPSTVGGPVSASTASTSTTDAYLITNATFPCNATVTSWVYTRTQEASVIYASVWRTMVSGPENYFLLIGRNRIPPGKPGKRVFTVDPRFRIVARKGDFLGFHYSVKSDSGALASWSKDDVNSTSDDVTMHQTITSGLYDENFLLNVPINFNTNDRKVRMIYNALSAVVLPDVAEKTANSHLPKNIDIPVSTSSHHPVYPTLPTLPSFTVSRVTSAPKGKSISRVFCHNVTAEVKCDRSLIKIEKARYGHTQMPCRDDWTVKNNVKVFQSGCVMNVWPLVHGRCANKVRCRFHISEDVFGRPCSGSRGTGLNVIYRCIPAKDPSELLSPYSNDSPIVVNMSAPQATARTSKVIPHTTMPPAAMEKQMQNTSGISTTILPSSSNTDTTPALITTKEVREPLLQEPAVNGGLIAGVVCGLIILLCLFITVILIHRKRSRRKKTIPRLVQSFLLTERLQPNPLYDSRSNVNTPRDGRSPSHEASSKIFGAPEVALPADNLKASRLHVGWLPQSDHAVYESVNTSPSKSEGSGSLADRTYYNLIGRTLVPDTRGRSRSVTGVADVPPDVDTSTYQAGSGPL